MLPRRETKSLSLSGAAGGVSLGTAQNTVVALEAAGLLERTGRGPATRRSVTDAGGLLDLYARDAVADRRVIARGFLLNNGADETMRTVAHRMREQADVPRVWFSGVAAAQMLAPHVTAVRTFEAWVATQHRADSLLDAMGAMSAQDGANLVVMRGHEGVLVGSKTDRGVHRVSRFRIYADALADPARGEEQAEYLRETVIGF